MVNNDLLEYAESAGLENLRNHVAAADTLAKEANTTLTVLLAGAAGSLAYTLKLLDGSSASLSIGLATACFYLFALSASLVWRCMKIDALPNTTNEPQNLYQADYSITQIREAELKNIQNRIRQADQRNTKTAYWLNRIRLFATGTPLVISFSISVSEVVRLF